VVENSCQTGVKDIEPHSKNCSWENYSRKSVHISTLGRTSLSSWQKLVKDLAPLVPLGSYAVPRPSY
jgi:hypothetical protein